MTDFKLGGRQLISLTILTVGSRFCVHITDERE